MKNLIKAFTFCFLFLALSSFVNFGGSVIEVVADKNTDSYCSFTIPSKYVNEAGDLVFPVEVRIIVSGKMPIIFSSKESNICLPSMAGTEAIVSVSIADFSASKSIKF